MVGRGRGTFIDDVPKLKIENGLVIASSEVGDYVMLPSTLRKYVETGRRLLAEWDTEQRGAVPFRRPPE